jgi:hypothetical protein
MFMVFLLGAGTFAFLSLFLLGQNGTKEFIEILLLSAGGEWYGMKENVMYNLIGLLTRILPDIGAGTIRAVGWIVYVIAILCLCLLWGRNKNLRDGRIGITVILVLFVSPHLHFHDLALLLIPIYDMVRLSREDGTIKTSMAITIPIAISLLLLLSNLSPSLQFTTPYLIMLAFIVYPYFLKHKMSVTTPHRS